MELSSSFILLIGFSMIALYGPRMFDALGKYMKWMFSPTVLIGLSDLTLTNVGYIFLDMIVFCIKVLAPVVGVIAVVAVAVNYLQVGMLVSFEAIKPNFSKIDPIKGFSRFFSLRSFTELVKSLAKIGIIGYICFSSIRNAIPEFVQMQHMDIPQAMVLFAKTTMWLVFKIALLLIFIAILDYVYQKFDYEKSMRMTKQEVKDEYKQREGDPLIRRRIRERQREIAMRRMMAAVPNADVVITNPVELAIALEYDADEMHAPKIVAKGGGVVAERIKQIARDNKVPIIEDKPLAQSLFRLADVGEFVPPQLFKAVAEILAYVYRISKKQHKFGI